MEVSKIWFRMVKKYYDLKYYTNEDMKIFVESNKITSEDYKTITGVDYVA